MIPPSSDSGRPEITHQRPAPQTASDFIELAYGVLWLAPADKSTPQGIALANARQILLDELDLDARFRGLTYARHAIEWLLSPNFSPKSRMKE